VHLAIGLTASETSVVEAPEVRYARSGAVNIAYQVIGDGPVDLLYIPGWISHLDLYWEEPTVSRFLRRLAAGFRLMLFDRRGTGLSDRVPDDELPTLEGRMDDARAVLDAEGSEQAVVLAQGSPRGSRTRSSSCCRGRTTFPGSATRRRS
jgi:hypothetical protein